MNALMTPQIEPMTAQPSIARTGFALRVPRSRMREAFPAKCEYELTERLGSEFEEQLKKNLEQGSSLRDDWYRRWHQRA